MVKKALSAFTVKATDIAANGSASLTAELYVGPKDQEYLKNLADGLDLTIDYGIFWWLAQPIFWLMTFIWFVQTGDSPSLV